MPTVQISARAVRLTKPLSGGSGDWLLIFPDDSVVVINSNQAREAFNLIDTPTTAIVRASKPARVKDHAKQQRTKTPMIKLTPLDMKTLGAVYTLTEREGSDGWTLLAHVAELLGISHANTSYRLNILLRYDFVEYRSAGKILAGGRKNATKVWKITPKGINMIQKNMPAAAE